MRLIISCLLAAGSLLAADATGKWIGTIEVQGESRTVPAYVVLKQEEAKITGTAGPNAEKQDPIQNGKADASGKISFEVVDGDAMMTFTLQQTTDEVKGDVTREQDGRKQAAKIQLKRESKE